MASVLLLSILLIISALILRSSDALPISRPLTDEETAIVLKNESLPTTDDFPPSSTASWKGASPFAAPYSPKGITYHGGAVMSAGVNVYIIWYGTWTTAEKNIIKGFVNSLSATNTVKRGTVSGWWSLNTLYYNAQGKYISNSIKLKGEYSPGFSAGKSLTDSSIIKIVKAAITGKKLAKDSNGLYFVLTSPGVKSKYGASSFCKDYCGYHYYFSWNNVNYKHSMVGNSRGVCKGCEVSTPNGITGIDGVIDTMAHELTEALTDPTLRAWYDSAGYENADKCGKTYGSLFKSKNGKRYNLVGAKNAQYIVQTNWNPRTGKCDNFKTTTSTPSPPSCKKYCVSDPSVACSCSTTQCCCYYFLGILLYCKCGACSASANPSYSFSAKTSGVVNA